MNIQALMKQAQKIQQEMQESKKEIDNKVFTGESSFVKVELTGDKRVKKVEIKTEKIDKEEIELVEDMIVVALNEAINKIDKEIENKMGKYTQNIPGLF